MTSHGAALRAESREKIMAVATRLFVAHGYDGISMREIAGACGLSKPGLYYHFKDKEDLFLAILNSSLEELGEITASASLVEGGVRAQVRALVAAIFTRLAEDRRDVIRLANSELGKLAPENRQSFSEQYQRRFIMPVRAILQAGVANRQVKPLNVDLAVWGLLGLMYPFLNPGHGGGPESEGVVDFIIAVFFEGVGCD